MAVEFRVLGHVELLVDGRRLEIGHARQRCILAAFLIDVNHPIEADQLVDRVWSDRPPDRSRNSVAGYVSRLRKLFADIEDVVISREPAGYVLKVDPLAVDLHRFRLLVVKARESSDPVQAAELFDRALHSWTGEPFAGMNTPWASDVRTSLQAERFSAELDRFDAGLSVGRHAVLLSEIAATQAAHPLDERVAGQFMLALYRSGRQADALEAYQVIRNRLVEELGIDPGAGLQEVHQQILTGQAYEWSPDHVAVPALCQVSARAGVGQPWRHGVDGRASMPQISPLSGYLPVVPGQVVGREAEAARLREFLAQSRLVTLTGVGGVGKTTLALHVAAQLRANFPDGVWLVELGELRDGAMLEQTVAAVLKVRDQPARSLGEVLLGVLGERHMLLVLDNCEHLIDDAAKFVDSVLRKCPRVHVLATSRGMLDLVGETSLAVSPLAVPDSDAAPNLMLLADYPAVELFVQRARAVVPDFVLTEQNAAAVARVCAGLEGLPLAIELAAARLRAMSADQIADGLAHRYALLTQGRRGAASRHRTLAHCIDWSYQLCTRTEQRLWEAFTVFAGSFDLAAARHLSAQLIGEDVLEDLVGTLVDKSIMIRVQTDDDVRFRLLETLRDYGTAHLDPRDRERLLDRHAHWYHQLVLQARAQWFSHRQLYWFERLKREHLNIREAMQHLISHDSTAALEVAVAMRSIMTTQGMLGEARRWLESALNAIPAEPTPLRVHGLGSLSFLVFGQGDLPAWSVPDFVDTV